MRERASQLLRDETIAPTTVAAMVASGMARRSLLPRYGATAREDREMTVGLLTYQDPWRGRPDLEHPEVGTEMDPHPEHVRFEANLRGATRVLLAQERPGLFVADRGRLVGLVMPSRDLSRASLDALGAALPALTCSPLCASPATARLLPTAYASARWIQAHSSSCSKPADTAW